MGNLFLSGNYGSMSQQRLKGHAPCQLDLSDLRGELKLKQIQMCSRKNEGVIN